MFPKNVISVKTNTTRFGRSPVEHDQSAPDARRVGRWFGCRGRTPDMGKPTGLTNPATRLFNAPTMTKIAATSYPDDRVVAEVSALTTFTGQ